MFSLFYLIEVKKTLMYLAILVTQLVRWPICKRLHLIVKEGDRACPCWVLNTYLKTEPEKIRLKLLTRLPLKFISNMNKLAYCNVRPTYCVLRLEHISSHLLHHHSVGPPSCFFGASNSKSTMSLALTTFFLHLPQPKYHHPSSSHIAMIVPTMTEGVP